MHHKTLAVYAGVGGSPFSAYEKELHTISVHLL